MAPPPPPVRATPAHTPGKYEPNVCYWFRLCTYLYVPAVSVQDLTYPDVEVDVRLVSLTDLGFTCPDLGVTLLNLDRTGD